MESITDCAFSWPISRTYKQAFRNIKKSRERTLVVFYDIAQMIASTIMSFSHADRVVSEIDVTVIA